MGGFDLDDDLRLDGIEFRGRRVRFLEDELPQAQDGTARLPLLDLFARAIRKITHALRVRPSAVGAAFQ